jgi:hypothetical protein
MFRLYGLCKPGWESNKAIVLIVMIIKHGFKVGWRTGRYANHNMIRLYLSCFPTAGIEPDEDGDALYDCRNCDCPEYSGRP